jgi:hypothetical protein
MSLVPSLLFVGLWRGLMRLREDRIVDDVLARVESDARGTTVEPNAFLGAGEERHTAGGPVARGGVAGLDYDEAGDRGVGGIGDADADLDARERLHQCHNCDVLRPPTDDPCPTCGATPPSETWDL